MKTKQILTALLFCATLFTLPSCLGDDDDDDNTQKELTKSQKDMFIKAVNGQYKGKGYFINAENKMDSIDLSWTVNGTDSSVVVHQFPIELLAQYTYDGSSASEWLLAGKKKDIHLMLHPTFTSDKDIANKNYAYYFIPDNYALKYNEEGVDYTLGFGNYILVDNLRYYCVANYDEVSYKFAGNIIFNSISSGTVSYPFNSIFWLSGKKQ